MKELNTNEFSEIISEEKVKILDDVISENEKKIKSREEFNNFLSLWLKVYLSIPILTLVGVIVSSAISTTVVEALFPYFLSFTKLSFAIFGVSLVVIPTKLIVSKTIKNLKKENLNIKDIMDDLQKQLDLSMKKSKDNKLEEIQDSLEKVDKFEIVPENCVLNDVDSKLYYQTAGFNQVELQLEQCGPKLIKKLTPQGSNENKQD